MASRGVVLSYEVARAWAQKFGGVYAKGVVPSKHLIEVQLSTKNLTMRGVDFKRHFSVINVPKTAIRNNVRMAKSTAHTKPFLKKLKPSSDES